MAGGGVLLQRAADPRGRSGVLSVPPLVAVGRGGKPAARRLLPDLHAHGVRALLQDVDRGVRLLRQGRRQAAQGAADVHA
eukprot:2953304-Pyramimonas_sp.AAC.1